MRTLSILILARSNVIGFAVYMDVIEDSDTSDVLGMNKSLCAFHSKSM